MKRQGLCFGSKQEDSDTTDLKYGFWTFYLFIFKGDTQACGSSPSLHFPLKASHAASNQGSSYMAGEYPSLVFPNYVQGPASLSSGFVSHCGWTLRHGKVSPWFLGLEILFAAYQYKVVRVMWCGSGACLQKQKGTSCHLFCHLGHLSQPLLNCCRYPLGNCSECNREKQ